MTMRRRLNVRDYDDLDISLDQTIRMEVPTIPPEAMLMLVDEDTPTLVVVPSALAALAERSMQTTAAARPWRNRADEELALRRAVYGIWAVAAVLLATLALLIK